MGRTWLRAGLMAAAVGAVSVAVTPADAAKVYQFAAGEWQGGAYTDSEGRFAHCAVTGKYQTGTSLVFLLRRDFVLALRLANKDWQLGLDATYEI